MACKLAAFNIAAELFTLRKEESETSEEISMRLDTILEMADEVGWASMLSIYNMVALARAGGKPGILGAVCVIVNLVPVAGTLVSLGLYVYISIGLARRFDQGVLFGLGLAYLPYVFYPILALSDRGFD